MAKFQHAYRYIDDVCLFSIQNPRDFLSPIQSRTEENPFWIYPLNVLEIKEETSTFSELVPTKGIAAHFMNIDLRVNELHPELYSFINFDKRWNLPFPYILYIKLLSNRAVHQLYNIVVSQLVPILYISNYDTAAMEEIMLLITTILGRLNILQAQKAAIEDYSETIQNSQMEQEIASQENTASKGLAIPFLPPCTVEVRLNSRSHRTWCLNNINLLALIPISVWKIWANLSDYEVKACEDKAFNAKSQTVEGQAIVNAFPLALYEYPKCTKSSILVHAK
jgi:hypothetical protein